jgi:hypothetical protein
MNADASIRESPETRRRARQLVYAVYVQALFLALAYIVGVWLTTMVHDASITLPEVIGHGVTSSVFALMTGLVGLLAAVQGRRRVSVFNTILFLITVFAGTSGFSFLGNPTDAGVISNTNVSMMAIVGVGMPVTVFSLANVSRVGRGADGGEDSPALLMIYMALGALSLTMLAGAVVRSPILYPAAIAAHAGLAALTVSLVLGVLVVSILEGSGGTPGRWVPRRVGYSLLGLASVSIAAGNGVMAVTAGGLSYVVLMAELGVLVYGFLMFAAVASVHGAIGGDKHP